MMIRSLLAYGVIPGYTLLFVRGTDWFSANFSVIGSLTGRENGFAVWGLLTGCTLYWLLFPVIAALPSGAFPGQTAFSWNGPRTGPAAKPVLFFLLSLALLLLTAAVILPYLPDSLPLQASLHTWCAFLAAVSLFLCLVLLIRLLRRACPARFSSFSRAVWASLAVSILLLAGSGIINTALELYVTLSACVLSRGLSRRALGR